MTCALCPVPVGNHCTRLWDGGHPWERAVAPALATRDCPSMGKFTECQSLDAKPTDTHLIHWSEAWALED